MTTVSHVRSCGRFIEIQSHLWRKKLHRKHQGSNFLGGSFNNRNNVRATFQFRRKSQPQHLKRFFSRTDQSIFTSQGSTTDLKRVYISTYVFKNLGVRHVQGKNYKKLKKHKGSKSTSNTKDEKPF